MWHLHGMTTATTEMRIKELRAKHDAIMARENDLTQDAAVAVRREIMQHLHIDEEHCQSCGRPCRCTCGNQGYSECCGEIIMRKCNANSCFHLA
jgi:hypothetical protein